MFVIMGGNGKIGRTTAATLRKSGHPVRVVVRSASKADALREIGCEVAIADIRDADALTAALAGATAAQVICPADPRATDPWNDMQASVESAVKALARTRPYAVLAISDYGAELPEDTGVTLAFHHLETRLRTLSLPMTFLRSAEHMQNWGRVIPVALETGFLPTLHHPVTKLFPTISAHDVGIIAADLLLAPDRSDLRIVHAEGPKRYSAEDVAEAIGRLAGKRIIARELPRKDWIPTLVQGGVGSAYAGLVAALFDGHNAGLVDAEAGAGEIRYGATSLEEAFGELVTRR